MNINMLAGLLRHLLTASGGAGLAISDNDIIQILSALATIGGILWSLYNKRSQNNEL